MTFQKMRENVLWEEFHRHREKGFLGSYRYNDVKFATLQEVLELTETTVCLQDTVDKEKLDNNPLSFYYSVFIFLYLKN